MAKETADNMRGTLFKESPQETVFKDESILYPDHLPETLPHREGELEELASAVKPIISNRRPRNVFVFGPPGVGKTASSNFVLRELKENTDVVAFYLNCWKHNTRHAVLTQLCYKLGTFAPRRGTATDEIFEKFSEIMNKRRTKLVVVLDEIDRLLIRDGSRVIYDLLRPGDRLDSPISLILISNDKFALRRLDDRTRSSLNETEIGFEPYNAAELKDIYRERAKHAFIPGMVKESAIAATSQFVAENGGDARLGLECLLRAGQAAEGEIGMSEIRPFLVSAKGVRLKERLKGLPKTHTQIMRAVALLSKEGESTISGEVFSKFEEISGDASERTYRKHLSELEELGLVSTEKTGEGFRGRSRVVNLRAPAELVLKLTN